MVSYAQNGEDVLLRRLFGERDSGFYIDVGAHDPRVDSVTKHFYDRGWHGINIEPLPGRIDAFDRERPRDSNLAVGLSDTKGMLTFHEVVGIPAHSTFDTGIAGVYSSEGAEVQQSSVEVTTLADVCTRYVTGEIDFLTMDVEGFEEQVVSGGDWDHFRPRVVVGERINPASPLGARTAWEPLLVSHGYVEAFFDGVNAFLVREEDYSSFAPKLAAPANPVLDAYDPYVYVDQLEAAGAEILRLRNELGRRRRRRPPTLPTLMLHRMARALRNRP
jgi:FkbM family methyltransferase